jgi:hypothetical protein
LSLGEACIKLRVPRRSAILPVLEYVHISGFAKGRNMKTDDLNPELVPIANFMLAVARGTLPLPPAKAEDVKLFYQIGWMHEGISIEQFPAMYRGCLLQGLVKSGAVKEVNDEVFQRAAEVEVKNLQMTL